MTKKLTRGAELRVASFDEGENSVEVVWTTGAAVRRRDWRTGENYSEVLEVTPKAVRLDRLNAGAPLLDTHRDGSLGAIIGSVVPGTARIENGLGIARVRLSNAPGDADIVSKIRDGIIRNISVGYAIHGYETEAGPHGSDEIRRVVDWEPLEISAVPVPADAGSQVRSLEDDDGEIPEAGLAIREALHGLAIDAEIATALRMGWASAWIRGAGSIEQNADDAYTAAFQEYRSHEVSHAAAAAAAAFTIVRHMGQAHEA
ncbi:hypothetical protein J2Y63_005396 [Shinella sp. BE166]|uniref:HK97 family phage prohead protease n=1 Tax=Shinella sp. BE166 TaxID=3373918 RepID=UPI003EB85D8A